MQSPDVVLKKAEQQEPVQLYKQIRVELHVAGCRYLSGLNETQTKLPSMVLLWLNELVSLPVLKLEDLSVVKQMTSKKHVSHTRYSERKFRKTPD